MASDTIFIKLSARIIYLEECKVIIQEYNSLAINSECILLEGVAISKMIKELLCPININVYLEDSAYNVSLKKQLIDKLLLKGFIQFGTANFQETE